uniref:Uncharacterized protein n=1 Tax=Anguilla anguilla TaxID=7936 RepID=A0A0E9RC06_ANGAN
MTLFTRLRLFMVPGAGPESSLIACSWHALVLHFEPPLLSLFIFKLAE